MQQTKTALRNINMPLSHDMLVVHEGLLPAVRARFRLLMAGVRFLLAN